MPVLSKDKRHPVQFTLNGEEVDGFVEPRLLLADFLRQQLGATGTHVGCEHGICGACTVRIDGKAQRACLTLAVQADGRSIETIEGMAKPDGSLSTLQQAFHENFALQCGFCTPGILMSMQEFLEDNPDPTDAEVREALSGNICRCTGYAEIVAAVLQAAKQMREAAPQGAE